MFATLLKKKILIAEFVLVVAIVALGGFLRFQDLRGTGIEGVQPDEARIGLGAASIIHYGTPIFNYDSQHEPPLSLYYPIPFMLIFGRAIWVLKLGPILFGLGAIVFTYLVGREMFSVHVGAVSAFFLAILPFSVIFSRILWEHSFLPFYSAGILYYYAKHLKTGSARPLYLASLFMGLALSTKIIVLYFMLSFCVAVLVSGRELRPRINMKQAARTCLFFFLGAAPFIALLFLSPGFFNILSQTRGGGIMSASDVVGALRLRLSMAENAFSPVIRYAIALWAIVFVTREKTDGRLVFLFVLCTVFLCVSIITVSGLGIFHLLVLLPAPLVLVAGLVDLPVQRSPAAGWAAAIAVAAMLVIILRASPLRVGTAYPGEGVNEMTAALEAIDPDRTLPAQRDIKLIHEYLHYRKTGALPPLLNSSVVSYFCNRFKDCYTDSSPTLFPDFDFYYRGKLKLYEKSVIPWNAYIQNDFFSPARAAIFEETLLELISKRGYRYLIISLKPQPGNTYFSLNRQLETAVASLSRKGALHFKQTVYKNNYVGYKILEVIPQHSGTGTNR